MRGLRIALAVIPAAAITLSGGAALAASTPHAAPSRTAPSRTAPSRTVILSCLQRGQVEPSSYMIACGDGSEYLTRLRWASWTPGLASGTGRFYLNTCTPDCARGRFLNSQVIVVLWRPAAVPHRRGVRAFTRMTVIYDGRRPAHTAQSFTQSLWYPII